MKYRHSHNLSTTFPPAYLILQPRLFIDSSMVPALSVSLTVCFVSLCYLLSRKHQQCFCPGLHQRLPDCERPVGQRKPTLLGRILSHCQGERLNEQQLGNGGGLCLESRSKLFHSRIKSSWYVSVINQCSIWIWQSQKTLWPWYPTLDHTVCFVMWLAVINVQLTTQYNRYFYILTGDFIS